jgi:sigma-E factor negative regulatory protein RseC
MIQEVGIVTKVEGVNALVAVEKKSACDGCTAGTCELKGEAMEIEALNVARAKEGQTVRVSMKPQTYLKGTMLVYGLPLVLFIAGAIAGKNMGEEYFRDTNSDMIAALCGFGALILSLIGVREWAKKMESNAEYKPVIEEIVDK